MKPACKISSLLTPFFYHSLKSKTVGVCFSDSFGYLCGHQDHMLFP